MIEGLTNRAIGGKPGKNPAAPSRNQEPSQLENRDASTQKRAPKVDNEGQSD